MKLFKLSPIALALASFQVFAGSPNQPDAGRTLQENAPVIQAPIESQKIEIEAPAITEAVAGGAVVKVESVSFSGNTVYDADQLNLVVGAVSGKEYDLAGLKSIANQISQYYRQNGYSFARAYLPAQPVKDGVVQIAVIEGNYGSVATVGDEKLAPPAQKFLSSLSAGQPIHAAELERAVLVLDDQPGIKVTPLVRPGQAVGTGDLDVRVDREKRFSGVISADNHGNRYTGRNRVRASVSADSPFMLGDQLSATGLYTSEDMWFGVVDYSLPIGGSGLRAKAGASHVYYELGKQFKSLDAQGTADIIEAGLSYPIFRSQRANLNVSATYQQKWFTDEQKANNTKDRKSSDVLPISLSFDLRDGLAGGGVTYGSITWTHGDLDLGNGTDKVNDAKSKTDGRFNKLNLDVARIQLLPNQFTAYARVSAQYANENLDSSEGFGLGGVNGVRAYPSGEAFGDEGALFQAEVRYAKALSNGVSVNPYLFYDVGTIKVNQNNWTTDDNRRTLSGAGLGVRASYKGWNANTVLAWRMTGGKPESDTKDHIPMFWMTAGYQF
ncbi:MAG: polymerase [Methylotenera sp.]|uniref:ShlB/FhaC/HecB family hemolysin secretion/activation protein n=1 Tax=Methylotenera sp. TaxID=2051956 RepID=UPI000D4446A5|nr:ShlB/FhaC/HecB family hemolysin secretion/activation protein [Methylotenera sp.]PPC79759.1 MAG: polymerase [Methylotenera sp.]